MAENTATDSTVQQGSEVDAQQAQEAADNQNPDKTSLEGEDLQAALRKAREEAARYRVERNEFREDAEKFREQQEAEKSELQKAQEAAAEHEAMIAKLQADNARLQVVTRFGIAEENIDLLGSDPEKFESNAQRIAALQEADAKRDGPPLEVPLADMKPGSSQPADAPDNSFPQEWLN